MVVLDILGKKVYFHPRTQENLDYYAKALTQKWDSVLLLDGEEGSGKTSLGCGLAAYMADKFGTTFDVSNVVFTADQFNKLVDDSKPFNVIFWDEFTFSGLSTEVFKQMQINIVKKFTTIRKKQLIIILIIPYIFQLQKYFAVARAKCLFHVYSPDNLKRGYFRFYSRPSKRRLYIKGYKFWEYPRNSWDFEGTFIDYLPKFLDLEAYDKKKEEAIKSLSEQNVLSKAVLGRNNIIITAATKWGVDQKEIAKASGLSRSFINRVIRGVQND